MEIYIRHLIIIQILNIKKWKNIIADMDSYAEKAIKDGTGNAKLNLQLDVCK